MPNSLLTGITGLVSHQRKLDAVAHNLANLNTVAYKSQRVLFADLLYETTQSSTSGNETVGGTNPNQIGSGVKTAQISKKMTQGNLEATGQPFDFALRGEGFFVVNNGGQDSYTRAGAFSLDNNGYLVDPSTGAYVQRFGAMGEGDESNFAFQVTGDKRVNIPLGKTLGGQITTNLELKGNLLSSAIGPRVEVLTSAAPFRESAAAATPATLLNDLDSNNVDYVGGDQLEITGTDVDGSTFSTTIGVGPLSDLDDIVNAINGVATDATASIDADGNLVFEANEAGSALLSLSITDVAGGVGQTDFNLHSSVITTNGKDGDRIDSSVEIYDLQGNSRNLPFSMIKTGANVWNLEFNLDPEIGTITNNVIEGIQFDEDGTYLSSTEVESAKLEIEFFGITAGNGAAVNYVQTVSLDPTSLTQFANEFDVQIQQDGRPPGKIITVVVDVEGTVRGVSSNGDRVPIAQLAIASFSNQNGLDAVGSNYFEASANSGDAQLGAGGSGGRGSVTAGQLEASNVDMALEFTQLIVAQRGFSANARTITVSNEMLQELTNIIR